MCDAAASATWTLPVRASATPVCGTAESPSTARPCRSTLTGPCHATQLASPLTACSIRTRLQQAAHGAGDVPSIRAEPSRGDRLLEAEVVQQRPPLAVDQQAAPVLVDRQQQLSIGADAHRADLFSQSRFVVNLRPHCADTEKVDSLQSVQASICGQRRPYASDDQPAPVWRSQRAVSRL